MKYPDVFNPDLSRIGTRDSQMYNVIAGMLVTDMVRTSLGPRGMEKMYIDILGEETITKHGGAFLRKLDVDHPAAKTVVDAVNTVDNSVGDGTTSAAILMGALLKQSRDLLRREFSTATITRGLEKGMELSLQILDEIKVGSEAWNRGALRSVASSCLEGKALFDFMLRDESVAETFVDAICYVTDFDSVDVKVDDIKIEEKMGGSAEIKLVMGTIIDKPIDNPAMPKASKDVMVLLLNEQLEYGRTRTESEIEVTHPEQMSLFARQEELDVLAVTRKVVDSGAGLVVSRKGIGELAQQILASKGIITIRRAKYNDLWWLEKATGARICKSVESISAGELGFASSVYEKDVGGDRLVFVESRTPRSVTLLLRSASKRYLDEFHRTALSTIRVLRSFIKDPFTVYGGGSCEAAVAAKVRRSSLECEGGEQVVLERFADAMEEIPVTLARNLGMDTLNTLTELRARHAANDGAWFGVDASSRKLVDVSKTGAIEPVAVKRQVIITAVEATCMVLNVDDVFMKDLIDNTHCHIDGTVHAHKDPGRNHNHWEQEGLEQRQMHHYY